MCLIIGSVSIMLFIQTLYFILFIYFCLKACVTVMPAAVGSNLHRCPLREGPLSGSLTDQKVSGLWQCPSRMVPGGGEEEDCNRFPLRKRCW